MKRNVVITGIGMITPLGHDPGEVLYALGRGKTTATRPSFDPAPFSCPYNCAIGDFDAENYFPENKTLRMMNRDAQMAVAAARLAMQDAGIKVGETYQPHQIALFGATGLSSLPVEDVTNLIKYTAGDDGSMDLKRFGQVALKRVRPLLSFKILANMPICFVSIFENIQGENAIYTPWEGQGAQAIIAGIRAVQRGRVPCALVGGCDVKTRLSSFISLQQMGVFESWQQHGKGGIPGEGAGFLVLEDEGSAIDRKKQIYARIRDYATRTATDQIALKDVFGKIFSRLCTDRVGAIFAGGDGDVSISNNEHEALTGARLQQKVTLRPKSGLGNLFAAAAGVQVGFGAKFISREKSSQSVLVNCFGHGSEHASFVLEGI